MTDLPLIVPDGCPVPPSWPPAPDWWDLVVVGMSNGKDSRVVLHDAVRRYPLARIVALYNILGNEHAGSLDEAVVLCRALRNSRQMDGPASGSHRRVGPLAREWEAVSAKKKALCTSST